MTILRGDDYDDRTPEEMLMTSAFDQVPAPRAEAQQIAGALKGAMEVINRDHPEAAEELGREYFAAFVKNEATPQVESLNRALVCVERMREELGPLANTLVSVLQAWDGMCRANAVWGSMLARALGAMHNSTAGASRNLQFRYATRPAAVPPDLSDAELSEVLEEMRGHVAGLMN